jgi:hypothetical protein
MKLLSAAARTTALAQYLQNFRKCIGIEEYQRSVIRREHGTGSGFFGVSNTGSRDCLKESIRGITDALGFSYRTPQNLIFKTESCREATAFDRSIHRVEHTIEVKDLFLEAESKFILSDNPILLENIGEWIVTNQITTWIEQREQLRKGQYTYDLPFSKYSSEVFNMDGLNVSNFTRGEITELNSKMFVEEIASLRRLEAKTSLSRAIASFESAAAKAHTLPPLNLATAFHDDEFMLLNMHYRHKLSKRAQEGGRWYSEKDTRRYAEWLAEQELGKNHSLN